jgi:hypothetical protein
MAICRISLRVMGSVADSRLAIASTCDARAPVPAEQSLGRDEKATPAPPWKKSAERSEDRSVCGSVAHAATELPLEHADLLAEHHQLDVLVQSCPSARSQYLKNAARDEVAETEGYNG